MALYRQKEIEFPVKVGMARFMAERAGTPGGGQRYDREGLYHWSRQRFPAAADLLNEEAVPHRVARPACNNSCWKPAARSIPQVDEETIDAQIEDAFSGTKVSEAEDAKELADWARTTLGVEVTEAELTGVTEEQARSMLWNAFDSRYRPEMRTMERSLLLSQLDQSWKNHLYTMDHLRASIGLRGMGQMDPKIEYKREGMQEFKSMWERRPRQGDRQRLPHGRGRRLPGVGGVDDLVGAARRGPAGDGRRRRTASPPTPAATRSRSRSATAATRSAATTPAPAAAARSTRTATCGRRPSQEMEHG